MHQPPRSRNGSKIRASSRLRSPGYKVWYVCAKKGKQEFSIACETQRLSGFPGLGGYNAFEISRERDNLLDISRHFTSPRDSSGKINSSRCNDPIMIPARQRLRPINARSSRRYFIELGSVNMRGTNDPWFDVTSTCNNQRWIIKAPSRYINFRQYFFISKKKTERSMDLLIEKNSVYPARFCLDDRTAH